MRTRTMDVLNLAASALWFLLGTVGLVVVESPWGWLYAVCGILWAGIRPVLRQGPHAGHGSPQGIVSA
ncbi:MULTISPECIES: hypothetical protein [unclassified Nocardiopsis]|uniref:hypothetical protein n=1 Tax=unclassified Nocardiopsis TaxID=2649073 RepID=UPI001359E659|nr:MULTISPECIES: hypothetical protein [unclassified Nocardiopsis]